MSYRTPTSYNDHRIFRRTAATTKKINISPKIDRGGTRL